MKFAADSRPGFSGYFVNPSGVLKMGTVQMSTGSVGSTALHATPEAAIAAAMDDCAKEHAELRRRRVALNRRQANLRKLLEAQS